ncbi:rhodanese-like domain-containing protein [Flavobacteriaceae bacterium M23B6Z8]
METLSPAMYADRLSDKTILIDVRTPEEFAEEHLANAINIDFFAASFDEEIASFKNEGKVYIYCRSGKRSAKAASRMLEMGFSHIVNLEGGLLAWKEMNKPTVLN